MTLIPRDIIPLQNINHASARETVQLQAQRSLSCRRGTRARKQFCQIVSPIIGGLLSKFGNAAQSDHLVIYTASALGCVHAVFRISDAPRDLSKGPGTLRILQRLIPSWP